MMSHEFFKLS